MAKMRRLNTESKVVRQLMLTVILSAIVLIRRED